VITKAETFDQATIEPIAAPIVAPRASVRKMPSPTLID